MSETEDSIEDLDPRRLIAEAYRIDGITEPECRTIFLDWALSLKDDVPMQHASAQLLAHYDRQAPDHPMTGVLRAGTETAEKAKRRGGYRARHPE
ncbi:hypothetical protein [Chachezhania sediminis]|uniref:hypothetical protein n=1 Tax=Chachezhania sediminis TaxID=2599291 RepID=UPI00131BDD46|nr:hypothetical protein [Chachezhania sediminis]